MNINKKFYNGFEGEPEMTFCLMENGVTVEKIGIWDGYFDNIMKLVRSGEEGWTGLAYFYHLCIGWYEEDNWLMPNISEAYRQLAGIDSEELEKEEKEVLILIVNLLKRAMDNGGKVYIVYD